MNENILVKLNMFQNILKNCIIDRFNGILPEEVKNKLLLTSFVDVNELKDKKTGVEMQGIILRKMLSCIINIKCKKDLYVNGITQSVDYGVLLEDLIIEYYANDISRRYSFDIIKNDELSSKMNIVNDIKRILDVHFDMKVLNNNAQELLSLDGLSEYKNLFDVHSTETFENNTPVVETNNEYEDLVMKYARGENLSEEEIKKLLTATPEIDENNTEIINQNVIEGKSMSNGFSYIKMTLYIFVITNILGYIIAKLLITY